jgi:hypothetical protein
MPDKLLVFICFQKSQFVLHPRTLAETNEVSFFCMNGEVDEKPLVKKKRDGIPDTFLNPWHQPVNNRPCLSKLNRDLWWNFLQKMIKRAKAGHSG